MENPEEILHSLEEFSKLKPTSIPRELEDYLCFVAKTGDPVYQWSVIKSLFREKLINVITEFYESCPSMDIPPCRNVDFFNYDSMKTFILEKLDTFVSAPFTVQRICELLTTPRKEYNRIDKYMRALEKNILVVSTTEPGNQRTPENGDGFMNGIESDHVQDGSNDINIEEMDDSPAWPPKNDDSYQSTSKDEPLIMENNYNDHRDNNIEQEPATSSTLETVICSTSTAPDEESFSAATPAVTVPIETNINEIAIPDTPITAIVSENANIPEEEESETEKPSGNSGIAEPETETVPAVVVRRRNSIEPEPEQLAPEPSVKIDAQTQATDPGPFGDVPVDIQQEIELVTPEIHKELPEAGDISKDFKISEDETAEEETQPAVEPIPEEPSQETILEDTKTQVLPIEPDVETVTETEAILEEQIQVELEKPETETELEQEVHAIPVKISVRQSEPEPNLEPEIELECVPSEIPTCGAEEDSEIIVAETIETAIELLPEVVSESIETVLPIVTDTEIEIIVTETETIPMETTVVTPMEVDSSEIEAEAEVEVALESEPGPDSEPGQQAQEPETASTPKDSISTSTDSTDADSSN